MVTCVLVLVAISIVIVAAQFSCLFTYQAKKEQSAETAANNR